MENHSSKRRPPATEKHHALVAAEGGKKRKSFSTFLIESDFKPLAFVGRCMQYFGVGAVVGFLLGAACVYGYAFFQPLPLVNSLRQPPKETPTPIPTQPPPQPKTVWLHGVVKSNDKPIKEEFEVGVLATRQGPFQGPDGSFSIQVPESDRYLITLWNVGYQKFKLVELKPDSDGNVHDVIFPSGMAKLEGDNLKSGPPNSYASVEEKQFRVKPNALRLSETGMSQGLTGSMRNGLAGLPPLNKRSRQ